MRLNSLESKLINDPNLGLFRRTSSENNLIKLVIVTLIMPSGQERNNVLIRKGNRQERFNDVCLSEKRLYGNIIHHIKSISSTYI